MRLRRDFSSSFALIYLHFSLISSADKKTWSRGAANRDVGRSHQTSRVWPALCLQALSLLNWQQHLPECLPHC